MNPGSPVLILDQSKRILQRTNSAQDRSADYQESLLQEIVDEQPSLLPVSDFYLGASSWFPLGREIPVDMGNTTGYIDNLLVTNDGHIVIIETKLWRNPESLREVVVQVLQYGMALSQLTLAEFETALRKPERRFRKLPDEQTVAQYVQQCAASDPASFIPDDFDDAVERFRLSGEILLLIVADGIRASAERLVQWINKTVGTSPLKVGLIELRIYDIPELSGRIVIPRTLLRIREASRHVISINLQGTARDQVIATVTGTDTLPGGTKPTPPAVPMTDDRLTEGIKRVNAPDAVVAAETLRMELASSGLSSRFTPSELIYGVMTGGGFVSLLHLHSYYVYFLIPTKALRALGESRFVECKRLINSIAAFYRPEDVNDASRTDPLLPRYSAIAGEETELVKATVTVAEWIREAMAE
jgi:hypothetical protein